MGARGRQIVEAEFSEEIVVRKTMEVYKKINPQITQTRLTLQGTSGQVTRIRKKGTEAGEQGAESKELRVKSEERFCFQGLKERWSEKIRG